MKNYANEKVMAGIVSGYILIAWGYLFNNQNAYDMATGLLAGMIMIIADQSVSLIIRRIFTTEG